MFAAITWRRFVCTSHWALRSIANSSRRWRRRRHRQSASQHFAPAADTSSHQTMMLLIAALAAVASFTFSTLAGAPGTVVNSRDGAGSAAQFDAPRGVAV